MADKPVVANCANCGAPMQADAAGALVCVHCGSREEQPALIRALDINGPSDSSCPLCQTTLIDARLDGLPLRLCQACGGLLVAMAHFVAVVDAARVYEDQPPVVLPRKQNPGDRVLLCPRCHEPMLSHVYGGPGNLVIDSCERCQVNWLDAGELRRIARAPRG